MIRYGENDPSGVNETPNTENLAHKHAVAFETVTDPLINLILPPTYLLIQI